MRRVYIDFESRSQCDIWTAGAYRYCEHPTTEILCLAWAVDDGPVRGAIHGSELRQSIKELNALVAEGAEFHAHNAFFERCMWAQKLTPRYGALPVPIRQWRCTAAKVSAHALPRALKNAAAALGCKEHKDLEGAGLMKVLAGSTGPIDADRLRRLLVYCEQDVRTEREIDQKLPDLCEAEQQVWFMDQYLNDTGVCVDTEAIKNAVALVDAATKEGNEELFKLTGGLINAGTKRQAIKAYLESKGLALPNLQKQTVKDAIATAGGDNLRVLQLRQQLSLTSNAKYAAFLAATSPDGRIRDLLVYHGASTGRWSGKLVQIQNLVKASIPPHAICAAIQALKSSREGFSACYDVLPTLSSCIRGMLIPSPGHKMFITDFAAIEARVVMWLAGETVGLRAFAEKDADPTVDDIYVRMAKQISPTATRQLGKQTVLGCLAEDTLVYSDTGIKYLKDITKQDKLWDGEKWVGHLGLLKSGWKRVTRIKDLNIELTLDHLILTPTGWRTAAEIVLSGDTQLPEQVKSLACSASSGKNFIGVLNAMSLFAAVANVKRVLESTNSGAVKLRHALNVLKVEMGKKVETEVLARQILSLMQGYARDGVRVFGTLENDAVTLVTPTIGGMVVAALPWPSGVFGDSWNTLLHSMGGTTGTSPSIELIIPKGIDQVISEWSRKVKTIKTRVKYCYDVLNVGEFNTFRAGEAMVHNCGFGMGVQKFIDTCAKYEVAITPQLAERAVNTYRKLFSKVPKFWYAMEDAARQTIMSGKPHTVGYVSFLMDGDFMRLRLPAGRTIVYHHPRVDADGSISFMAVNSLTNKYEREQIWGGKLVENAVQATARDLMVAGMFGLLRAGYKILFTVHDELVVEHSAGSEQEVKSIVCRVPTWAKGCPINAECESAERYKK
jgi:DNA polymerase